MDSLTKTRQLQDSILNLFPLKMQLQDRMDQNVLDAYPSTIRRRVLRYLYLDILQVLQGHCHY